MLLSVHPSVCIPPMILLLLFMYLFKLQMCFYQVATVLQ
jgi:hypothetical protein